MFGRFYAVVVLFGFLAAFFPTSWLFVSILDNEHIFIDLEEKLTKYFAKDWRQDSVRVRHDRFWSLQCEDCWFNLLSELLDESVNWGLEIHGLHADLFLFSITKRWHKLFWPLFLQGSLRRPFPLLLFLKVQYYVENGRLFWYVFLHSVFCFCYSLFYSISTSFQSLFFFFSVSCDICDFSVCVAPVSERHDICTTVTCGSECSALNVVSRKKCISSWQVTLCRLTSVITPYRKRVWRSPLTLNQKITFPPGYVEFCRSKI